MRESKGARVSVATFIKLPIYWAISLLIVVGPYAAIVYGLPWLVEGQGWDFVEVSPEKLAATLNPHYWIILAFYLGIAYLISPRFDIDNMGMFGTFWDNPVSFQDDANRAMLNLAILLAPGKFVLLTLRGTLALLLFPFRNR